MPKEEITKEFTDSLTASQIQRLKEILPERFLTLISEKVPHIAYTSISRELQSIKSRKPYRFEVVKAMIEVVQDHMKKSNADWDYKEFLSLKQAVTV